MRRKRLARMQFDNESPPLSEKEQAEIARKKRFWKGVLIGTWIFAGVSMPVFFWMTRSPKISVVPEDSAKPEPSPLPASSLAQSSSAPTASALPAPTPPKAPPPPLGDLGTDFAEDEPPSPTSIKEQRDQLLTRMQSKLGLDDTVIGAIRAIFEESKILGQGNPSLSEHPMSRKECRDIRTKAAVHSANSPVCAARNMVPIYNPKAGETEAQAKVCIDQYEYPNIPCEYPVVLVSAHEAVQLCQAQGKRLCDAHEWEGACAGAVLPAADEYAWGKERKLMSGLHNQNKEMIWAYGKEKDHKKCATGSHKSKKCGGGGYKTCGSNTYPTGAFPQCVSNFGVFDQHGNAAEHMNMPLSIAEMASTGNYGQTEMKGSWFIFQEMEAHHDDCRWRAPDWHVSKVMDPNSHSNYHLGFRCCKDVGTVPPKP